jgi:hypothetical protein
MNLDTAFRAVYGRAPDPEETNRFNQVARELDIRENDAIWAVTFLLGHHLDLAKRMPEQIEERVCESLTRYEMALLNGRKLAEAELAAIRARIEETISATVVTSAQSEIAKAAQVVARDTARRSWLQWLGSAVVAGMMLTGGVFYWGYDVGNRSGYARAVDVKAASSWAASDLGQGAYKLDLTGDLRSLIRCDRAGWTIERNHSGKNRLCIVHPDTDGVIHGWDVP